MAVYNHTQIEEKWLASWEKQQLFQDSAAAKNLKPDAEKMYLLFAFAYPSGSGLHVGHVESKTALDILARYNRMKGKNVFFPVGWDAFGLPAENYAIKTGTPPAVTTKDAINTFRRQIKRVGISYDWANELATNHPGYYKWTQWLFLQMHAKGLAYQGSGMVNWCPSCQTVLANEQVVNGACERCGTPVIQKDMKQWFFKITAYKDELISGLDDVDWPAATKAQQLNWIGKSTGAKVKFMVAGENNMPALTVFTTRIDTIGGVTFLAISPEKFKELGLMDLVSDDKKQAVENYLDDASKKTEEQRKIGEKDKTGVDSGIKVFNVVSQEEVPLYVADYVLAGYGTGVVMGVPAHDERDFAFAKKFKLPIKRVIAQSIDKANDTVEKPETGYGVIVNSGKFDGMTSEQALENIAKEFEPFTTYKLRDWLISRQRYWGAPIPIVYDPEGNPHPVKEEHLPWTLPTDVDFKPTGESPLKSSKEFIERTEKLYGKGWTPEYDTMDTFVDSSWYYFRYVDSRNEQVFSSKEQMQAWLPVDFYMIGPEHIVLHLLYSRFFTKFLRDEGYINFSEPFMKMRHQGMIMGPDGKKMSKSKGNVINPDEVIEKFGADTLRMYEMFMGPIEADKPWDVSAVAGIYRFLTRVHTAVVTNIDKPPTDSPSTDKVIRKLHQTLKKVSEDIPNLKFNTSIAALMELMNEWETQIRVGNVNLPLGDREIVAQMIAPFAPFLAEELYAQISKDNQSVHLSVWPTWNPEMAAESEVTLPVQVNGKVRANLTIDAAVLSNKDEVLKLAKADSNIQKWIADKNLIKEIYIPGKIVNLVVA
ncbi:MAG: leucyl-tRNA synthetase [Patescibacteria group bacterium]|nr:leucyl-tRNA synthetase [Patescibacteria group bacterium]